TLTGQPYPHPVTHSGGYFRGDVAAGLDAAVSTALPAGVLDDLDDASAYRARPRGHHLPEEGPLYVLHLARAAAGIAGLRAGTRRAAGTAAFVAQHRG